MADADPSAAADHAEDAKVRAEWRRLEKERIDEEVAEAREDVETVDAGGGGGSYRLVWIAFAVALVAGLVVTALIEGFSAKVPPGEAPANKGSR